MGNRNSSTRNYAQHTEEPGLSVSLDLKSRGTFVGLMPDDEERFCVGVVPVGATEPEFVTYSELREDAELHSSVLNILRELSTLEGTKSMPLRFHLDSFGIALDASECIFTTLECHPSTIIQDPESDWLRVHTPYRGIFTPEVRLLIRMITVREIHILSKFPLSSKEEILLRAQLSLKMMTTQLQKASRFL